MSVDVRKFSFCLLVETKKEVEVVKGSKQENSKVSKHYTWKSMSWSSICRVHDSTTTCPLCELIVGSKECFDCHVDEVKHAGQVVYTCKICQFQKKSRAQMKRHIRFHTCEKNFQCLHCPYKAVTSSQVKRHMESQHGSMYIHSNVNT